MKLRPRAARVKPSPRAPTHDGKRAVMTAQDTARSSGFVQSLGRGLAVHQGLRRSPSRADPQRSRARDRLDPSRGATLPAHPRRPRLHAHRRPAVLPATPRVLELGYACLSGLTLTEIALPAHAGAGRPDPLSRARSRCSTGRTSSTSRASRPSASRPSRSTWEPRFPPYATSMGRVMLAAQPPTWIDGYTGHDDLRHGGRRRR